MLTDPYMIAGGYVAASAAIGGLMARVSPTVGPKLRNLFAGVAPMTAVFASLLDGRESVVVDGSQLAMGGAMVVAGVAASALAARLVASSRPALRRDRP